MSRKFTVSIIKENAVAGLAVLLCAAVLQAQTFVRITDTTNPIVSDAGSNGFTGASWIDFNGDGLLDLFANRDFLYQNNGGGAFLKINVSFQGNLTQSIGSGNSWADYDNDGDPDLFYSGAHSRLYRNDGNSVFAPVLTGAIGDSLATAGWASAWADYDNDGYVDLFITHPANFIPTAVFPNHLLHNDGPPNFTFTRVTNSPVVTGLAPYTVGTWSDYDNDGDVDLFVGSGPAGARLAVDFLYRNLLKETGAANFERITTAPIATDLVDGQVWNWIDYDNDGDLDAYLTNYGGGLLQPGLANNLYRNDNGAFVRMTGAQVGVLVTDRDVSLANVWGDVDNDSDLDLIVTKDIGSPTRFYLNNGNGTFARGNAPALTSGTLRHASATLGDYDKDGDLDVYLTGAGTAKGLFRNDLSNGNHWINILCEGVASNRSGLGTKLRARAIINGAPVWQLREISSQNSFNGHNMLNAHFGLGNAASLDSLKIEWPSGRRDTYSNVAADRSLIAKEGQSLTTGVNDRPGPLLQTFVLEQNYPNPFNPSTRIRFNLPQAQLVTLTVFDVTGRELVTLIDEHKAAGEHAIIFEASQLSGSGVYFYRLRAGEVQQTRKMILIR